MAFPRSGGLFIHCSLIELDFEVFFVEEGKPENPEKNVGTRTRTNNKLNLHMTLSPGIEPGPHCATATVYISLY